MFRSAEKNKLATGECHAGRGQVRDFRWLHAVRHDADARLDIRRKKSAWKEIHKAETTFDAAVVTKERFDKTFGQRRPLPSRRLPPLTSKEVA
jgi:hypothetical protein